MNLSSSKWWLFLVSLALLAAACDTYTYMPTRSRAAAPAAESPTVAPVEPAQAPPPAVAVDYNQRLAELEARLARLENRLSESQTPKTAKASETPGKPEKTPAAKAAKAAAPSGGSPQPGTADQEKVYTEGLRLYQTKKYTLARDKFHQYLKSQSKGPRAAESRYYLADSFYQEKQYQEAGVEFGKLVNQYPKNILAPAAMLRQSLCYYNQQKKQAYRLALKKLINNYPQSPEAKEAQKWLKEEGKPSLPGEAKQ